MCWLKILTCQRNQSGKDASARERKLIFAQFIFCFKIVSHPIELNFCQIGLMNAFRGIQRYGHREIEVLNLMRVYYYTSAQRKNGWITTNVLPFMWVGDSITTIRMKTRAIYERRAFSSGDSINNAFITVQVTNCCYKAIIVDFNRP